MRALRRAEADLPAARARAKERAQQIVDAAQSRVDNARARLHAVIADEYERGARVGALAERSGYTRETIRRILRAAGIEPG